MYIVVYRLHIFMAIRHWNVKKELFAAMFVSTPEDSHSV